MGSFPIDQPADGPATSRRRMRTLWILIRPPFRSLTFSIFEHPSGRELRVYYGQDECNVIATFLSPSCDQQLMSEASALRARLEERGWIAGA